MSTTTKTDFRSVLISRLRGQTITVPDLAQIYAGWTIRRYPDIETIRPRLETWITTYVPTKNQRMKQRKVDSALLSGYFWPAVPEEKFESLVFSIAWAFFWDDEIDCGSLTHDCEGRADAYCDNAIAFVRSQMQPELHTTSPAPGHLHNSGCFVSIGQAMQVGQTVTDRDRYVESLVDFIESVRESHAQSATGPCSVDQYIERRLRSIGTRPVIYSLPWSYGLTLPSWIWNHASVSRIIHETLLTVSLYNDIVSLQKELAGGEVDNIVPILVYNDNCTAQEAVDKAVDMIKQSYRDFCAAVRHLKAAVVREQSQVTDDVDTLIDACMDVMVGNVAWSMHTPRYISRDAFNGIDQEFTIML
jgi:hypothetical protein